MRGEAAIFAGVMALGGVRKLLETHTTGGVLFANMTPNAQVVSYQTDESWPGSVYVAELVDGKSGWQFFCVEEEAARSDNGEMQDFMECAAQRREPLAGVELAFQTMQVQYAAHCAAEEGQRVSF